MAGHRVRWFTTGLLAAAGAGMLALTSATAYGEPGNGDATDAIGLVMGGSGEPIPGTDYVDAANTLYIGRSFPDDVVTFPGTLANGLFTPEQLYPIYPPPEPDASVVKQLPFDTSVAQGVTILNNSIEANLATDTPTVVFGYSQSATISSLEMEAIDPSGTPSTDPIQFVLVGDPNLPNGGLLERFNLPSAPMPSIPSLGVTFSGATPADSFPTAIYTIEYDGFADFPRYPIDLLADLNAFAGIATLHNDYLSLPSSEVESAITLPTSGATETTYYLIPETNLPLLDPVRDIPVIGAPLANLVQPDLTVLVNLGYGANNLGYSDAPANIPTPLGLFPDVNPLTVLQELAQGAVQGIQDALAGDPSGTTDAATTGLSSLPSLATMAATIAAGVNPADILSGFENAVNALSSAASTAYATLLPTADIINALVTTLPAYDASVFVDNLTSGNVLDALGLPLAADVALVTLAAGFEFEVIDNSASAIMGDLTGLIP